MPWGSIWGRPRVGQEAEGEREPRARAVAVVSVGEKKG